MNQICLFFNFYNFAKLKNPGVPKCSCLVLVWLVMHVENEKKSLITSMFCLFFFSLIHWNKRMTHVGYKTKQVFSKPFIFEMPYEIFTERKKKHS